MSKPIRGKLTKYLDRAMSITESTGLVRFSFKYMGEKFHLKGNLDKGGYFRPNCNTNEFKILNLYILKNQ